MAGGDKNFQPPFFFAQKKMANEAVRLRPCGLRRDKQGFSSRGDNRSSLKTAGFLPCHGVMQ